MQPHRFVQRAHKEGTAIIVPRVSSERREYIPMDFVDGQTVISDLANAIYGAEPWLFGLIHSRMHMSWVRAVGGRMKNDFRYSAMLVYNNFPVPDLTEEDKAAFTRASSRVLAAREQFSDSTLAELYDPDKMPGGLRAAHRSSWTRWSTACTPRNGFAVGRRAPPAPLRRCMKRRLPKEGDSLNARPRQRRRMRRRAAAPLSTASGMREMQAQGVRAARSTAPADQGAAGVGQVAGADVRGARQALQPGPQEGHRRRAGAVDRRVVRCTELTAHGFFADWEIKTEHNLCSPGSSRARSARSSTS